MKLYEMTEEYMQLMQMLEDGDTDEEIIRDTLEAIEGDIDDKMENYAKVLKSLEAEMKAIKEEVDRLTRRRKTLDNRVQSLKKHMFDAMKATGKTKAGGNIFKISIQKNGGKLPVILDVDPLLLPDELSYTTVEFKADDNAIRKLLDEKGSCPFAHYGERGESLRIR